MPIVGQTEKRCKRCKQVKLIDAMGWEQCKMCNAELAAKRARRHIIAPRAQEPKPPKPLRIRPEDMLLMMHSAGVARHHQRGTAPIVELSLGESRKKYRWHPLYVLLNGLVVGSWIVLRLPSPDDVRKAQLALRDVILISYIQDFDRYHYETKRGKESTDLWVCKHYGRLAKHRHYSYP